MKSNLRVALASLIMWQSGVAWAQALAKTPVSEPASASTVLSIDGQHWTAERFAMLLDAGKVSPAMDSAGLTSFVNTIADRHVLAKQAQADGLANEPRIAEKLALLRETILADEESDRLRRMAPVDAAAVRAEFEARPGDYDELEMSQILISPNTTSLDPAQRRTPTQALALAQSLQQQLKDGADFETLARKYSDDSSRVEGGRLPSIFAKDLRPEMASTVNALKPQQVSDPVGSADGYHLIRLEHKTVATFDSSRRLLEFNMRDAWADQQMQRLRQKSPVSFDDAAWLAQRDRFIGP